MARILTAIAALLFIGPSSARGNLETSREAIPALTAWGQFQDRFGHVRRRLDVATEGHCICEAFTLPIRSG